MPPLVVLAMINTCDKDLTCVSFFTASRRRIHDELMYERSRTVQSCLRCFIRHITPASESEASQQTMLTLLSNSRVVVEDVRLFEEGELCLCKKIP